PQAFRRCRNGALRGGPVDGVRRLDHGCAQRSRARLSAPGGGGLAPRMAGAGGDGRCVPGHGAAQEKEGGGVDPYSRSTRTTRVLLTLAPPPMTPRSTSTATITIAR